MIEDVRQAVNDQLRNANPAINVIEDTDFPWNPGPDRACTNFEAIVDAISDSRSSKHPAVEAFMDAIVEIEDPVAGTVAGMAPTVVSSPNVALPSGGTADTPTTPTIVWEAGKENAHARIAP